MLPLALTLAFQFDPGVVLRLAIYLAILGVLVVFHEFGHFAFAKWFKVTVTDFAVGFGPTIAKVRRGGTDYRLNLLPLGGYCKMVGEDEAADGAADPGNFQRHPLWQRFTIIAAGPIFNLVLAVTIFALIGVILGVPVGKSNVVEQVLPGKPAARAGIVAGDQIVAFNGQPFKSGDELVKTIRQHPHEVVTVSVLRNGKIFNYRILTDDKVEGGKHIGQLGFLPHTIIDHKSAIEGVAWGFTQIGVVVATQIIGISDMIARHDASMLTGPVGIARAVITVEQEGGLYSTLMVTGTLSVILGIFNLLPVPALDGGRLAFLLVELVRGRAVAPEKEGLVHLTGFALLMLFVLFVTYQDIVMWVQGKSGL